jgi:hypothetical protein
MILRLVRTQLRSEWKQTILGVGTLSLALALATASMIVAATSIVHRTEGSDDFFDRHEHFGGVVTKMGDPFPAFTGEYLDPSRQFDSHEEIEQLVAEAETPGASASCRRRTATNRPSRPRRSSG